MAQKKRLDAAVQELHPEFSKTLIQQWIQSGQVKVNGLVVTKPGIQINALDVLEIAAHAPTYVSRAGEKLAHALRQCKIGVTDFIALDAGLSTGGFTDCLLQQGVKKVYGVDVGHGQVHEKIKNDARVVVMERTNLRTLTALPEQVDIVTLDLSFISLLKVIDVIVQLLKEGGVLIALIKPQFEAGKEHVGTRGIIKDPKIHEMVVQKVIAGICTAGFEHRETVESPVLGGDGNKEFLACFVKK